MKKLKLFSLLLLLFVGVGQMWAAVVSGTTYSTPSSSGAPQGWTISDGGGTSYAKLIAEGNYIETDAFCVSSFTSIKVKARKFGGPSDAQALITVSWFVGNDETILGTIAPTNTTLTDYTISNPTSITANSKGYIRIRCKGAGSSKGSGVSEVTITYTAGTCGTGGTEDPTVFFDTSSIPFNFLICTVKLL